MSESKTTATAVVTATVTITLNQPWSGAWSLADVLRVGSREARDRIRDFNDVLAQHGMKISDVASIQVVINEEKVP